MLATNYRCPRDVVEASGRIVAVNRERFVKPIRPPASLAPDPDSIGAVNSADPAWTDVGVRLAATADREGRTLCFLARTRGELVPVMLAVVRAGIRHATSLPAFVEAEPVLALVDGMRGGTTDAPFHAIRRLRAARGWTGGTEKGDELGDDDHAAIDALLGWALRADATDAFVAAFDTARARIAALRDPGAAVELATVHGSKGREWETVVLVGFEAERMPNARSLADAVDPARALEEERRLAYVALTRATRRLILGFDPARPSPFLAEMGLRVG